MPRRRQLTVASAGRAREIVEMRTQRLTFEAIGRRFGIAPSRAHRIYWDTIASVPVPAVDELRAEQNQLAELAVRELVAIALSDTTSARTRVEALSSLRLWAERVSKLNGVDVDTRQLGRGDVIEMQPDPADFHEAIAAKVLELRAAGR